MTIPVLVLHDVGDPTAGRRWADLLGPLLPDTDVRVPALPGHGTPPRAGGNYDVFDPVYVTVENGLTDGRPVVVGIGRHGCAAQAIALGGEASAVVTIDGLGGPWEDAPARVDRMRAWMRAQRADPGALAHPAPRRLDPRLASRPPPVGSRTHAEAVAAAMPVPALAVETAGSPLAPDDVGPLVRGYRNGALAIVDTDAAAAEAVAGFVTELSS